MNIGTLRESLLLLQAYGVKDEIELCILPDQYGVSVEVDDDDPDLSLTYELKQLGWVHRAPGMFVLYPKD